jgi:hypothetical protein
MIGIIRVIRSISVIRVEKSPASKVTGTPHVERRTFIPELLFCYNYQL